MRPRLSPISARAASPDWSVRRPSRAWRPAWVTRPISRSSVSETVAALPPTAAGLAWPAAACFSVLLVPWKRRTASSLFLQTLSSPISRASFLNGGRAACGNLRFNSSGRIVA